MLSTSSVEDYFADNYTAARQKFLDSCAGLKLQVDTFVNDINGNDVELAADVIRIGSSSASKLLVLTSGVHGAELMCGSGCQVGMLEEDHFASLPADTAVLMIHAINPWGAANLRRNNEDNVDLCRNFVDFSSTLPLNAGYEEIHAALCCIEREGPLRQKADNRLTEFRAKQGDGAFVVAVMSGQYSHDNGMSFGGNGPVWSHLKLLEILQAHAVSAEQICLIDYHSGLGPYAHGSVVCMHEGEALQRAQQWFGSDLMAPMKEQRNGNEKFHPALGHTTEGYLHALADRQLTSVVLEYGTHDMKSNLQALLDDHWLTLHGDDQGETGRKIKKHMLETHYPDDPEWRYAVWSRSQQVIEQALGGLAND